MYLPKPSTMGRMRRKVPFLSGVRIVQINSFPAPRPVVATRTRLRGKKRWIHAFFKSISWKMKCKQDLNSSQRVHFLR